MTYGGFYIQGSKKKDMDFTVIENEMVGQTGYSRRQLQNFREGSTQKKGNTVYTAEAILIQGKD